MYKILLVDDVTMFLEIEKGFLGPSPVTILTAKDGEEALSLTRKEHPDLVVMDLNMPKMDGVACCTAIKTDPALRAIPVIMLSNASRLEDVETCWKAGCDDFLAKPVDGKLFLEMMHKFLPVIERRTARVRCQIPVTLQINDGKFSGICDDISMHGLYVATDVKTTVGSDLALSFHLPGSGAQLIEIRGRVLWLNRGITQIKPTMPIGFGVEFIEITGEGLPMLRKNELKAFVEAHQLAA